MQEVGEGSVGAVLHEELSRNLSRLRKQERRVRAGADSSVHKMRIAARRMRSLLATYRPILHGGTTDDLRAELKWLGLELSAARDAQVMQERFERLVGEEPVELLMGPVSRRIQMEMSDRARAGREQALAALDDPRYVALLESLDAFLATPPFDDPATRRARKELPRLVKRDVKRVRRRAMTVDAAGEPTQRDLAMHETRKAAKRLRYASESAQPVLGKRAKRLAARSKRLQELLGEHQDTVVARRTLRELGAQAFVANENGFSFGRLHALEQARAEDLEEQYPDTLERLLDVT